MVRMLSCQTRHQTWYKIRQRNFIIFVAIVFAILVHALLYIGIVLSWRYWSKLSHTFSPLSAELLDPSLLKNNPVTFEQLKKQSQANRAATMELALPESEEKRIRSKEENTPPPKDRPALLAERNAQVEKVKLARAQKDKPQPEIVKSEAAQQPKGEKKLSLKKLGVSVAPLRLDASKTKLHTTERGSAKGIASEVASQFEQQYSSGAMAGHINQSLVPTGFAFGTDDLNELDLIQSPHIGFYRRFFSSYIDFVFRGLQRHNDGIMNELRLQHQNGLRGLREFTCQIRFAFNADGQLVDLTLTQKSGIERWDYLLVEAMRALEPFRNIPPALLKNGVFQRSLGYSLSFDFGQ